ncbi:MAG TPA: hypothetical protein VMW38_10840 [Terriglobia bacterium]|nr:hypothetical protein [Terriglobia bacterium]
MNIRFSQSHDADTASYSGKGKAQARGLWLQAPSLIGCVAMLSLASVARAAELPRLRIRTAGVNAHHLIEDANDKPIFMVGICPQNFIQTVSMANMNAYFKARHERGFNIAWAMISGRYLSTSRPDQ